MSYIQVNELKKSRELWQKLGEEHELVITRDGRPRAILIGIEPEELETALPAIRRALFSAAVGRVRARSAQLPPAEDAVREALRASRT